MNSHIPRISIVVPIYKVQDLLDRCVISLINQTNRDIEIILVDDGSPDDCPKMCDSYAKQDSRIRVIHKENGGLSDARNEGIKASEGQYILFVDSDDYIDLDTCEKLINLINEKQYDIITFGAKKIVDTDVDLMSPSKNFFDKEYQGLEYFKLELKNKNMKMAVWLNLYKKDFLIDNSLFFEEGLLHEDEQWTPRVFLKAKSVRVINEFFYNYVIRNESITMKKDKSRNGLHIIKTCHYLEGIARDVDDYEFRVYFYDYLSMLYLHAINIGNLYDKTESYDVNFLNRKPRTLKNKLKVVLFKFNKNIYKFINPN
ncbi:glycosyltransferase [Serpentinicella alkaliphila]|uniref:Glycosyl transferase family 2 n=1 Tax=Serpentinicella alkaliphila TaxID=1734049 RepID=A0A4R2T9M8_9FIRM|nr:glycosyltransferase [Serpentinicella alkaliphila]QUH25041.1 glycosyltransferase [Serpentinicella alkaliphila]TCP98406.1 glycosyl transferase family 2 [Serpentinicella alkaliphila]